jgi:hypothetical protein
MGEAGNAGSFVRTGSWSDATIKTATWNSPSTNSKFTANLEFELSEIQFCQPTLSGNSRYSHSAEIELDGISRLVITLIMFFVQ